MDLSLDEKGMARIEKISFDAYNESDVLIAAVERYFERTGHYSERILADKIYRNRNNLAYCKERGIRLSGPALGRLKKNAGTDKKVEYKDNADRIAVERAFEIFHSIIHHYNECGADMQIHFAFILRYRFFKVQTA